MKFRKISPEYYDKNKAFQGKKNLTVRTLNDKSIVTQNDLNKSKVTLGAMQISLHTNPFETTTNKCGIELGREERVRTYKLGLEGGL